MKILLTGRNGQLGWELARALAPLGEVTALDRRELDLADASAIAGAVRRLRPQLIVNAAAYTAVDRAETDTAIAHAVNAKAPEILAHEAQALDAALIHFSTDYVFDGNKKTAYDESDTPAPQSAYGKSKLAGEQGVTASGVAHLILRTSWVYAGRGSNFLLTMLKLARTRPELTVVSDRYGAPTWARMIAEATALIIARCGDTPQSLHDTLEEYGGIYHLNAAGRTTWHEFAKAILREAGLDTPVRAIRGAEYSQPAPRPANSMLATEKLASQFGVALPGWEQSLKLCIEEMMLHGPRNGAAGGVNR